MENISKKIDHTLLKASATQADIIRICAEAKQYGFASVCVNSCYAKLDVINNGIAAVKDLAFRFQPRHMKQNAPWRTVLPRLTW